MKTGELFVEPVLIGFAVLFTAALMGSMRLEGWILNADIGKVALVAPAAYFAGIVFDRIADTLLGHLEHHHRLQFALKKPKAAESALDPFPEDQYHVGLMGTDQAWEHAYYLRSRIRIVRALIALTPALGLAIALRVADESRRAHWMLVLAAAAIYLFAFYLRIGESTLPRTPDLANEKARHSYQVSAKDADSLAAFAIRNEPLVWTIPAIAGLIVLAGIAGGRVALASLLAAATVIATSILTWCWWRITETFYTFLRNYAARAR